MTNVRPRILTGGVVTPVLPGDNVLDVKREKIGVTFMQLAILAAPTGSRPDKVPENCVHQSLSASIWRDFDLRIAINMLYET